MSIYCLSILQRNCRINILVGSNHLTMNLSGKTNAVNIQQSWKPIIDALPSIEEIRSWNLEDLVVKKNDLKQQLKKFDIQFARRNGRVPVKEEKEPIRLLYNVYNEMKDQICLKTHENTEDNGWVALEVPLDNVNEKNSSDIGTTDTQTVDSLLHINNQGSSRPCEEIKGFVFGSLGCKLGNSPWEAMVVETDLAALSREEALAKWKEETGRLYKLLKTYEKDFFQEHNRQVGCRADIKPVMSFYRRYNKLKANPPTKA